MPKKNESGKRYGKLVVTEKFESRPYKGIYYILWWCICDCGIEKWIKGSNLRAGRAVSCGCGRAENENWGQKIIPKDSKYFFKTWLNAWKSKAKRDNREFSLTLGELDNQYEKQNGRCYYTNDNLILADRAKFCVQDTNISIDRIDINQGYTASNIVFCLKMVNIARNMYSQQEFITMCRRVANNPNLEDKESLEALPNKWKNRYTDSEKAKVEPFNEVAHLDMDNITDQEYESNLGQSMS